MHNRFTEVMRNRTNADLVEIVTTLRSGYDPLAIETAEEELRSRNLTPEQYEAAKEKAVQNRDQEEQKAFIPLETHWRVLCVLFPTMGLNLVLAIILKTKGYEKKFTDIWQFTLFGLMIYAFFFVVFLVVIGNL